MEINKCQVSFGRNPSNRFKKQASETLKKAATQCYDQNIKNELLTRIFHDYTTIKPSKLSKSCKDLYKELINTYIAKESIMHPHINVRESAAVKAINIMM